MLSRYRLTLILLSTAVILYVALGGVLGKVAARSDTYRNLAIFNDVIRRVQDDYVERPDMALLTAGALDGLVQGLDPFSGFLPPEQHQFVKTRREASGETGLVLTPRIGHYRVLQILPGSPAEAAGILPGDVIEEIDGQGVSERNTALVQAMLRGEPGSTVRVGLIRGREEDLLELTLTRAQLPVAPPEGRLVTDGVGCLRLPVLDDSSVAQARAVIRAMVNSGAGQMVLDLRSSSAGTYTGALALADLFLREGALCLRQTGRQAPDTVPADPAATLFDGPLVVLINGYTCGPAEVVAAALQAAGRASLVGAKTFGGATEQHLFELEDGSAVCLTTVRYLVTGGEPIYNPKANLAGIRPIVKSPEEDFSLSLYIDFEMAVGADAQRFYAEYTRAVNERQLEKALEVLRRGVDAVAADDRL